MVDTMNGAAKAKPQLNVYAVRLEWVTGISYLDVVVRAATIDEALEKAAQDADYEAQDEYGDCCGDTYVGSVVQAKDVEAAEQVRHYDVKSLPIPEAWREDKQEDKVKALRAALAELVEWAARMGGYESECWQRASGLLEKIGERG